MGDLSVHTIKSAEDRNRYYRQVLADLKAFERMLATGLIEDRGDCIGVEQEMCLVDDEGQPSMKSREVLHALADHHYTIELGLFNLEINLDPVPLRGQCFESVESQLRDLFLKGKICAEAEASNLFLTGILPTIQRRHLAFEYMTPADRYRIISDTLLKMRGSHFEIYLQGVDDFNVLFDSVLFEACNTSFQCHLQVSPRDFIPQYNWAQLLSAPVLSCATNAPLLFGRELWAETRIALFKQSMDTRGLHNFLRLKVPRVHFGNRWITNSPIELWQHVVSRFPVLLQPDQTEDALSMLDRGVTPKLKSLQLHNGTSYTWNRLCYGVHENVPHIRIECRYLPAGPTLIDQMANFAFWIGLMKGQPEELHHFYETLDFRVVKDNFIRAARTGINSVFNWLGKHYPARELILDELLPMAAQGLSRLGVNEHSSERLLKVIEARVQSGQTGSEWAIENSRRLRKKYRPAMMSQILVQESLQFQNEDLPVSQWPSLSTGNLYFIPEHHRRVEHLMQSDILSIHQETSMEVAESVMQWNKIHHLPVESEDGELVGFVDAWSLKGLCGEDRIRPVGQFVKPTFAITPDAPLSLASRMMEENDTTYLAVMEDKRLVGIITRSDL